MALPSFAFRPRPAREEPVALTEPETAARFRQLANRYRALDVAHDDWKTRRVLRKLIRDYENAATSMEDAAERERPNRARSF